MKKGLVSLLLNVVFVAGLAQYAVSAPQPPQLTYTASGLNVTASWTAVSGATGYRLYYAPYPFAGLHTIGSIEMQGQTGISVDLWDGAAFYIAVTAYDIQGESEYSNIELFMLPSTARAPLNDTGIDWYANDRTNYLPSVPDGYAGQDAQYGRDARARAGTLAKVGGGSKGFDFTKIAANGSVLANNATNWSCVRDNVTGLTWEIKTDDGGLRDKDNYYTWYNPDPTSNGGSAGAQNGGNCTGGISCNTAGYVAAVNDTGMCGARDWRMPTVRELESIVDRGVAYLGSTIDTNWFPNTPSWYFWSGSPYARLSGSAWFVNFNGGYVDHWYKSNYLRVRLVRGGQ